MNSVIKEDGRLRKVSLTTPLKREKLLRCSLSSNLRISGTCFENETQHTPKRKLGPCPHMGCVVLWFIRFM